MTGASDSIVTSHKNPVNHGLIRHGWKGLRPGWSSACSTKIRAPTNKPKVAEATSGQPVKPARRPAAAPQKAERQHTGQHDDLDGPPVGDSGDGEHHQYHHRRDGDEQKPALFEEHGTALVLAQRTPQAHTYSEHGAEDVAEEDRKNGSEDDGRYSPEPQLLPAVVNDQNRQQVIVV